MKFITTRTLPFITAGLGFLAIAYVVCTAPLALTAKAPISPNPKVYEDVLSLFATLWLILALLFLPAYGIIHAIKNFRSEGTRMSKIGASLGVVLNGGIYVLIGWAAIVMVLEG